MQKPAVFFADEVLINRFDNIFFQTQRLVQERDAKVLDLIAYKEKNDVLARKVRQLEESNRILEKKYKEEADYSAKLVKIVANKIKQTNSSESATVIIEGLIAEIDSLITQLTEYK